ncbi:hypothetical protein I5515_00950 [Acinetobacter calcoaceticus]|uniref:hypothetical protein n=1 Tax=Acinetobacter calcoaceticus TaxID=471 RepID=UPI0019010591|nr:hypothetical protein [Acinetobacter calcoaceticus]MBJ9720367.1 hypothetical protein [Acinetobacter calcoaceticus]
MNLIRLEELSLMSNAVLTPQLNNWPCVQSENMGVICCNKQKDSFSEQSDKKFYKEWLKQQKKILKTIPSNAVLVSIKDPL